MKINRLRPQMVEQMPETLENGIIYISERYRVALHNCCCGCGEEVSTPLGSTEFSIRVDGPAVTLRPSIGNHDFACRSHYFITNGSIDWAPAMTRAQIEAGRAYDRRLKEANRSQSGFGAILSWIRTWLTRLFK